MEKQDRRNKTKLTGFRGLLSLITVLWEGDWSQEVKSLRHVFTNFMSPYLPFFFLDQLIMHESTHQVTGTEEMDVWRKILVMLHTWGLTIWKKYWNDTVIMNFFSSLFSHQLLCDSMWTINFIWENSWRRRKYLLCLIKGIGLKLMNSLSLWLLSKHRFYNVSVLLPELC